MKEIIGQMIKDNDAEDIQVRQAKKEILLKLAADLKLPNEVALKAEKITKKYTGSRFTLELDHLELRLGEITGLLGENATGKTTLFRILAGDLVPDSGILQYPLFAPRNKFFWPELKTKIAYVPQDLPVWLGSLEENLRFEAALHGIKDEDNQKAVAYIVQRLGLVAHLDKSWAELSGGYKLRFALAKALVWNAQLLIIDEPLAFLDVKTQLIVLNALKNLASSLRHPIAIIVSSQHLHEIEAVADQMLFMRNGRLEHLGRTSDWGKERTENVFEFSVPLAFAELSALLEGLPHFKLWNNGMSSFISTPLDISGQELLHFLATKQIPVSYFRDISRSVKTKFYEEHL
ncbi:ATP-binding cassette domain-containing protein [Haliscomenobacter hydrossis]|uniref:ABC transporter ATP-binding protein n=1 Tax=Haliscomenobacter hydrossis TaxID=2350 RepID=UPI0011D2C408|nr:ABC transporter ATP-binding protein [Haliscomenobacter hydrossis]